MPLPAKVGVIPLEDLRSLQPRAFGRRIGAIIGDHDNPHICTERLPERLECDANDRFLVVRRNDDDR